MSRLITRILLGSVLFLFFLLFSVVFISNAPGRIPASASLSPKSTSSPSASPPPNGTSSQHQTIEEQLTRIEQEISDLKQQPKDIWSKISSLSPLVSGVLVATIGAIATYVYNKRQREAQHEDLTTQLTSEETRSQREIRVQQAQTVETFLPHLISANAREKETALVALSTLDLDPNLVVKLATMYKDEGGEAALERLATSPDETVATAARRSVTAYYDLLRSSVVRVSAGGGILIGTGFAVADGRLIATADYVVEQANSEQLEVQTTEDATLYPAMVQGIHSEYGLAFLRIEDSSLTPMSLPTQDDLEPLATVILLTAGRSGWQSRAGSVQGVRRQPLHGKVTELQFVVRPSVDDGDGGGPIVDRTGKVVGMILRRNEQRNITIAIPASLIRRTIPPEFSGAPSRLENLEPSGGTSQPGS